MEVLLLSAQVVCWQQLLQNIINLYMANGCRRDSCAVITFTLPIIFRLHTSVFVTIVVNVGMHNEL